MQQGGGDAEHHRQREQHVHELVVAGGGLEDAVDEPPPDDQQDQADPGRQPGQPAAQGGDEVIGAFVQADRLGPGLRDDQAHDVAGGDGEDAVVEQR
ncbi:hypothetical protein SDC9_62525 [bioreactor metagenome]|uniref:Uncharacterized protein n=1 Tax=bioreactor metagenome TaxID=1076179 RepID=A0A644XJ76_9ZZZZ